MLTIDSIYHASEIINGLVRKTALIPAPTICPGVDLYLKPENLQITGSFKLRGAYYKISQLTNEECSAGVIACSAGNHAQGVALAATKRDIHSVICLPETAPVSKIDATRRYGAEVVLSGRVYDDAYTTAIELRNQYGYTLIHPFDDPYVIAGQGTVGLEIIEELIPDAIVVPVGGGGLISGVAVAVKTISPATKIYGVQADGAASMLYAIRNGVPAAIPTSLTIADGIAVKKSGRLTFDICSRLVDDIVTVTDEEIVSAILLLLDRCKFVTEGAGAAAVATVMSRKLDLLGKKVVCIISGGNIDLSTLGAFINKEIRN